MGEVRVRVKLENYDDRVLSRNGNLAESAIRAKEVEAVVDTGAVMNLLPQDLVEALGLRIVGKTIVALADEQRIELDVANSLTFTVAGRTWSTDCLVGPPGCEILLGQLVLERLDLIVDPLRRTLTPRPESPYLPTLKLKALRRRADLTVAA
jgi:clan AA aspartic protease